MLRREQRRSICLGVDFYIKSFNDNYICDCKAVKLFFDYLCRNPEILL